MNWDYIACFLDTDGSLGIYEIKWKSAYSRGVYKLVRIAFTNTNKEVLKSIQSFIGCGTLHRNQHTKIGTPFYILAIQKRCDCQYILENIVDRMYIKKQKAKECLEFLRKNPYKNRGYKRKRT